MTGFTMREIKICLLGESGVGKSSIAQRFVSDSFSPGQESTIGASFLTKTLIVGDQGYKFQIWDTAGQEKYHSLAPMYYRGSAAAIVVYDVTSEPSFTKVVRSWVNELKQYGPANIVIAIAGNKSDLEDLREVDKTDAECYSKEINAIFIETSAKTADNITELFTEITKRLPELDIYQPDNRKSLRLRNTNSYMGQDDEAVSRKRKCCGNS